MPKLQYREEPILEPNLPIIDPHHHLWLKGDVPDTVTGENPFARVLAGTRRYLMEDFLEDAHAGHNIVASIFVECRSMYRAYGPDHMKPVGEVEFAAGVAAMAENGAFGVTRVCAGIVGGAHLTRGDAVEEVLQACIVAGGGRFRGVRNHTGNDPDPTLLGPMANKPPYMLADRTFRAGVRQLAKFGLSLDLCPIEPQLLEVADLAHAIPDVQIILDHAGSPVAIAQYKGKRAERFAIWRKSMEVLARCPNVVVKLGGMGVHLLDYDTFMSDPPATSEQLATQWRPYIENCIEVFGVDRCMFESNYPADAGSACYPVIWNTFKRITAGVSSDEKAALYTGTARRVYKIAS